MASRPAWLSNPLLNRVGDFLFLRIVPTASRFLSFLFLARGIGGLAARTLVPLGFFFPRPVRRILAAPLGTRPMRVYLFAGYGLFTRVLFPFLLFFAIFCVFFLFLLHIPKFFRTFAAQNKSFAVFSPH